MATSNVKTQKDSTWKTAVGGGLAITGFGLSSISTVEMQPTGKKAIKTIFETLNPTQALYTNESVRYEQPQFDKKTYALAKKDPVGFFSDRLNEKIAAAKKNVAEAHDYAAKQVSTTTPSTGNKDAYNAHEWKLMAKNDLAELNHSKKLLRQLELNRSRSLIGRLVRSKPFYQYGGAALALGGLGLMMYDGYKAMQADQNSNSKSWSLGVNTARFMGETFGNIAGGALGAPLSLAGSFAGSEIGARKGAELATRFYNTLYILD